MTRFTSDSRPGGPVLPVAGHRPGGTDVPAAGCSPWPVAGTFPPGTRTRAQPPSGARVRRGRVYRSRAARRRGRVPVVVLAILAVLALPSSSLFRPFWSPASSLGLLGLMLVGGGVLLVVAGWRRPVRFVVPDDHRAGVR